MRLRLVRKRPIHDPVRMSTGQEREFQDDRGKELLEAHPGWFVKVKGGAINAPPEDPAPEGGAARTKPAEPRKK